MKLRSLILILVFLLLIPFLYASLNDHMANLSGVIAEAHLKPLASTMGAQANGGWFNRPPADTLKNFKIEVSWVGTYAGYKGARDEKFDVTGSIRFNYEQANAIIPSDIVGSQREAIMAALVGQDFQVEASGPTLFGYEYNSGDGWFEVHHPGIQVNFPEQTIHYIFNGDPMEVDIPTTTFDTLIGGYEEDSFLFNSKFHAPMQLEQITIGTYRGTQLILRGGNHHLYKIGSVSTLGIGLQHNITYWFHQKPKYDLTLLGGYQTNEISEIAKATSSIYGAAISKTLWFNEASIIFSFQLTYEQSRMTVKYDFPYASTLSGKALTHKVEFTLDGQNTVRGTLGLDWEAGIFNFRVEANLSDYAGSSLSLGLFKEF